ncbi:MAG: replication initiation factor [Gammaproteobacteria bacterium]
MKLTARSPEEAESATAQAKIGKHRFEVSGRGEGRFAYVLADNCFRVLVPGGESKNLPLAHVKFSSELLTVQGLLSAETAAGFVAGTLGNVTELPKVSRVDLCADVATDYPMDSWEVDAWVTRAHRTDRHDVQGQFSGWSIGSGGPLVCRLYDKTRELERKPRGYLTVLWREAGWEGTGTVWRLEFQFRREVLKELGISRFGELPANLGGLWRYATTEWLRLTIPTDADQTRSRWPVHPLWERFAALAWSPSSAPLKRVRTERLPSDEYLFLSGLGGLTSFMVTRHITDVHEGMRAYVEAAERYHNALHPGKTFVRYVREKLLIKGRRFNTLLNVRDDPEQRAREAEAYRIAKDGE